MSLIIPGTFQHILRVMNTNIDGKRNIMFAMTAIKGCGRRYANLVLKKVSLLFLLWVEAMENSRILYWQSEVTSLKVMELEENKCRINLLKLKVRWLCVCPENV